MPYARTPSLKNSSTRLPATMRYFAVDLISSIGVISAVATSSPRPAETVP
jgi:hypothetical protein